MSAFWNQVWQSQRDNASHLPVGRDLPPASESEKSGVASQSVAGTESARADGSQQSVPDSKGGVADFEPGGGSGRARFADQPTAIEPHRNDHAAWDEEAEGTPDADNDGDWDGTNLDEEIDDEPGAPAQRSLPPSDIPRSPSPADVPSTPWVGRPVRRPLGWNGKPKGRGLVKPDEVRLAFSPHERLLILDTWQRSGLHAGDFAPLVGLSKHTLYLWKKRFTEQGPAGLAERPRAPRPAASCRK